MRISLTSLGSHIPTFVCYQHLPCSSTHSPKTGAGAFRDHAPVTFSVIAANPGSVPSPLHPYISNILPKFHFIHLPIPYLTHLNVFGSILTIIHLAIIYIFYLHHLQPTLPDDLFPLPLASYSPDVSPFHPCSYHPTSICQRTLSSNFFTSVPSA